MHTPVLLKEVVDSLNLNPGKFIIDGTLGSGGHAKKIIEKIKPDGVFLGIDWDEHSVEKVKDNLINIGLKETKIRTGNYKDIKDILREEGLEKADGVLLDLGFSSEQLASGRGFSFQKDEPLLMTYDEEAVPLYKILKQIHKKELSKIIRELSGENYADKIAVAITESSKESPIKTTGELVEIIRKTVPDDYERGRINPATRTFMALRMLVNDELGNIDGFLRNIPEIVKAKGRIAIITFHSGEDEIVEDQFKKLVDKGYAKYIGDKEIYPTEKEIKKNARSRSAKLRTIEII